METKLPDEPSIARVLKTGEPFLRQNWDEQETFELGQNAFTAIVMKRRKKGKK